MRKPYRAFLTPARGSAPTLIAEPLGGKMILQRLAARFLLRHPPHDGISIGGSLGISEADGVSHLKTEGPAIESCVHIRFIRSLFGQT